MAHIMRRIKLAYFPAPKIACTSIKEFLYEIGYGEPFVPYERAGGNMTYIHDIIETQPFDDTDLSKLEGFRRIAVIRDPIERLLSAYGNRVVYHGELSKTRVGAALEQMDLPADPDLSTFVDNLARYRAAAPSIHHHTEPAVRFLGTNPSYFTRVYRFSELPELADDVRRLTNSTVALPRRQTGGPKVPVSELTERQIDSLRAFYAADYAFIDRLDAHRPRRPAPETPS